MPKVVPSITYKLHPGTSNGKHTLGYNPAVEPPMSQAETTELAAWLDDLSGLGLVQHLDPQRQRLTGHIPVRTPSKGGSNGH